MSVVYRHHQVMPQYTIGHLSRVAAIRQRVTTHRGLELAGNGFEGAGVPDCIHADEQAADKLLASLGERSADRSDAAGSYAQSGSDSSMSPVTA